ncbi:hypothetical protein [Micromonospora sp. NPDC023633]|uniref:hypothetical protein n=1 Tax=Micromonospora sp. NPDC023633 TaxID=3154320 RepID=UPI00340A9D1F
MTSVFAEMEGAFMLLAPHNNTTQDALVRPERLEAVAALLPNAEGAPIALQRFVDRVASALRAPCAGVSLILNDAGILAATHGVGGWLAEALRS